MLSFLRFTDLYSLEVLKQLDMIVNIDYPNSNLTKLLILSVSVNCEMDIFFTHIFKES